MGFHRLFSLVVVAALASLLSGGRRRTVDIPHSGIPRLPDGKPNLSAPAPRTAPTASQTTGVWRGAGPIYRFNIAQDLKPEDIQPWAEALFLQRVRDSRKDSPLARCLPVSVPFHDFFNLIRIVQKPALMVILYESPNSPHRIVFTEAASCPRIPIRPGWGIGGAMGRGHAGGDDRGVQRQRAGSTAPGIRRPNRFG